MAFDGYLTNQQISELVAAALTGGLLNTSRQNLLAGIPPAFANSLPRAENPLDQFNLDLVSTNIVQRMVDSEVPVLTLMQNCAARLRLLSREEVQVFDRMINTVGNIAAGMPALPEPATLPEVVNNEKIIGSDDSLDLAFFAGGLAIADAVARIDVPRFEDGVRILAQDSGPWVMRGTAWLLTPSLAITNHHVVKARLKNQTAPSDADFRLQAEQATLLFDFDRPNAMGTKVRSIRLALASEALDYAVLELAQPVDRRIPVHAPDPVVADSTSRTAVNVVQHPRGEYKRVAFRNNLVTGADDTIVRYFTDTDQGSSGSPVCDDSWRVVAIHRGSRHTGGVQFQGKNEAFVNYGSQLRAIMGHIREVDPILAEAIADEQP